jgi:uncharacterized protein (DUF362 family)
MAKVAISKLIPPVDEDKVFEAVKSAIDHLGGIKKFIKPGETVLLKPNFVAPRPPPVTTDIRVIKAVALQVKEAGAIPIIGESSSAMTHWWREGMSTKNAMDFLGVYDMAEEIGVKAVTLEEEGFVKTKIPDGIVMSEAELSVLALKVDKIIPLPVLKTSMEGGGLTCCIKVLHALTNPFTDRLRWHRSDTWQKLVDIWKVVRNKVTLSVVDGILGMEGDGPIHGTPVEMNTIFAGDDPVATEAIAAQAVGYKYPQYETALVALAYSQGLGEGDPEKIETFGASVDEVKKRFKFAAIELLTPHFKNVRLYEGACCRVCKAWMKFTLFSLKDMGIDIANASKPVYFFAGLEPPFPNDIDEMRKLSEKAVPVLFGECALQSMPRHSYWVFMKGELKDKVLLMPGCPPFACIPQATQITKALGLQISKEKEEDSFKYIPT